MAYTERKRESNRKWDAANLDRLGIALPAGTKARIEAAAARSGDSVNGWCKRTILARLDIVEAQDGQKPPKDN